MLNNQSIISIPNNQSINNKTRFPASTPAEYPSSFSNASDISAKARPTCSALSYKFFSIVLLKSGPTFYNNTYDEQPG